jgi:2-oxo-4-hydroxy-4-carboxy-5-ureidoimidazoline decarboxylase
VVAAQRPFASLALLQDSAARVWMGLGREDWLEAFSHHPRIGDTSPTPATPTAPAAAGDMSRREQSGMAGASENVRRTFVALNREYEARFGHVFLICATGKSADDMLSHLRRRINNEPATELKNAAGEQAQIMRLRLEQLITQP